MNLSEKIIRRICLFATLLGLVVVMLGAYTRLDDAGLGCPDWPGCYGQLIGVPHTTKQIAIANTKFPHATPAQKANPWPEMIHRYFAGTLSLCVFSLCFLAWRNKKTPKTFRTIATILVALICFQATLGMWTVTWLLLPLVVMGHLLGGMTITSLLWWQTLSLSPQKIRKTIKVSIKQKHHLHKFVLLGIFIVFAQISLGGWTAANYAALICPHFPFCRGSFFPEMSLLKGFSLLHPIGVNYEGGVLTEQARIAIQMVHRYGAFLTTGYLVALCSYLTFQYKETLVRPTSITILAILTLQITLGILNIEWLLPMPIAVAHNGIGLILLLSMVTLYYICHQFLETSEQ